MTANLRNKITKVRRCHRGDDAIKTRRHVSPNFYRAACNADAVWRWESCLSVRPSLCLSLSVKRVDCDKTEERSVQIFTPYERSFSL